MMKTKLIFIILLTTGIFWACNSNKTPDNKSNSKPETILSGKWVRVGKVGVISFNFKENGLVEGYYGKDKTVDVTAEYKLSGDTITFIDKEGQMCKGYGKYKVYQTDYYVSFDLISDDCSGRIKTIIGFWTRPNFRKFLKTLGDEIAKSPQPELYLNRARIYLAAGKPRLAKEDFDTYLSADSTDARVYINRAGTRFPNDLKGVVSDCNKAISLDPNNKNAYFLRGLARYELGAEKQGCEDFSKAIELGFSILKIAEQKKCIDYWTKK